jgi:hypothetical protein
MAKRKVSSRTDSSTDHADEMIYYLKDELAEPQPQNVPNGAVIIVIATDAPLGRPKPEPPRRRTGSNRRSGAVGPSAGDPS